MANSEPEVVLVPSSPIASSLLFGATEAGGEFYSIQIQQLRNGIYRILVNGEVAAVDANGSVLRPVLQRLPRTAG